MYIQIGKQGYELVQDNRNGWNPEAFKQRYSEVLDRYDYIVGDWGYNQLRLKGFYRDNHPKVNRDTAISGMVDYINEYCNFGCAYFVLQKTKELKDKDALVSQSDKFIFEELPAEENGQEGAAPKEPLREHLSSREHHLKMKQAKEASKAAAREAREAKEAKESKEAKEPKEPKEPKEAKEPKEPKEQKPGKEPRNQEDRPNRERGGSPRSQQRKSEH